MFKSVWKDDEGVSPVIATILMVAITVVLAGVLVVYMQQFSQGPGSQAPTGTSVATTFVNPSDGTALQSNGGGWSVKIQAMQGSKPAWSEVKVALTKGGFPLAQMNGVKTSEASQFYTAGAAGTPKWYGKAQGATPQFYDAGAIKNVATNEALLTAGEFETVTYMYFIVVDTNGDNTMNPGDVVFVYASNNGDTAADISGYSLDFSMGGAQICGSTLN